MGGKWGRDRERERGRQRGRGRERGRERAREREREREKKNKTVNCIIYYKAVGAMERNKEGKADKEEERGSSGMGWSRKASLRRWHLNKDFKGERKQEP